MNELTNSSIKGTWVHQCAFTGLSIAHCLCSVSSWLCIALPAVLGIHLMKSAIACLKLETTVANNPIARSTNKANAKTSQAQKGIQEALENMSGCGGAQELHKELKI